MSPTGNALTSSMWSEVPAVQVMAWRMLNRLRNESWAAEQFDMLYLDDEKLAWAKATGDHENDKPRLTCTKIVMVLCCKAAINVVLTKSLDKRPTVNAKVGTVVRNIRLVKHNTEQIEGKIEVQTIVILIKVFAEAGVIGIIFLKLLLHLQHASYSRQYDLERHNHRQ